MLVPIRPTVSLAFALSLSCITFSSTLSAAPAPNNTIAQLLDKSCNDGTCVEGYRIKFKQVSFEASRERATFSFALSPNQGIDYPIITEDFEAQMVQGTFAGICKIKGVPSIESILLEDGISVNPDLKNRLKLCLAALSERTETALGRR